MTLASRRSVLSLDRTLALGAGAFRSTGWDFNDARTSGAVFSPENRTRGTLVTVTGSQTMTWRRDGRLLVETNNQSSSDMNCLLFPRSFSVGDEYVIGVDRIVLGGGVPMAGLVFTDGTTSAANAFTCVTQTNGANANDRRGTLTNLSSFTGGGSAALVSSLYFKIRYNAANEFIFYISVDFGQSWAASSAVAFTLTPTHVGPCWTTWGGSTASTFLFTPLEKVA